MQFLQLSPPVQPQSRTTGLDGEFLVARSRIFGGLTFMGAKYLPTQKDIKASQRFQLKQTGLPKLKKLASSPPAKPGKKK